MVVLVRDLTQPCSLVVDIVGSCLERIQQDMKEALHRSNSPLDFLELAIMHRIML